MTDKEKKLKEDIEDLEEEVFEEEDFDEEDFDEEDFDDDLDNIADLDEIDQVNTMIMLEDKLPKGLNNLIDGYVDYAKEVVVDRAIPGIDGLKPSQRRILYTMKYIEKVNDLSKSANIAGATMKIHPHGDQSIYDTMVRMVSSSLIMNIPYLEGKGSFGKVYSSNSKASAARYTQVMLNRIAEEMFKGMKGIEMIPSYNNEYEEPLLLPVSFPTILCNPAEGIAVGLAAKIPSFNYHEVLKATIEYITKGKISNPLCPDFTTGGYYVKNDKELQKLMKTGNARLKLRGKWRIEGKIIIIEEIPYITTVEKIMKSIKDIPNIVDTKDESDRHGLRLTVECSNKKVVDSVLKEILRVSSLQCVFHSNIVVIIDNQPEVIGLEEIIKRWVEFREVVVDKELRKELEDLTYLINQYDILVDLMTTEVKRENFMETLLKESRAEAKVLLREFYPDAEESIFDWILDKSIGSLSGIGNKQKNYLIELREKRAKVEEDLTNVRGVIVRELKELNKKYKFPRRTEITDTDYIFDNSVKKVKEDAYPVAVIIDGMFIKKVKATPTNLKEEGAIKCMSDSIISLMDKEGNLMRVQVEQLDFSTAREKGMYIPNYIDVDFKQEIIDIEVIKNKKKGFLFEDGYASVIDFNEWAKAKRVTKVTEKGVGTKHMDKLVGPFRMDRDYLIIRTEKDKLIIIKTDFIIKGRKARTKLVRVGKGDKIVDMCSAHEDEISKIVEDIERFATGFRVIRKEDNFSEADYERVKAKNNSFND